MDLTDGSPRGDNGKRRGVQHNELNLFKPNSIFCMNGDSTWKSSLLKGGCGVVDGFRCRVNFPQFHLF